MIVKSFMYTLDNLEEFFAEVKETEELPIEEALQKSCAMVIAIPQNLLPWFKAKLLEAEELDRNMQHWMIRMIKCRMLALQIIN